MEVEVDTKCTRM